MKTRIQVYSDLKKVVDIFSKLLKFDKFKNKTGRKLAITIPEAITLALFKQVGGRETTKKRIYDIFKNNLNCSYKTLVVSMNRWAYLAAVILMLIMKINRANQHIVKHIDSTDIPVCLNKNAYNHKTMAGLAAWGRSSKGWFFGLKLHMVTDLKRRLLSFKFTSGNVDDRVVVFDLTDEILGFLVADAGYIKEELQRQYFQENRRVMFAKPKKNMKKMMTKFQELLYKTRMIIEYNFRELKCFYGLITSLPRSVNGYLANYIYSLLAYQIA